MKDRYYVHKLDGEITRLAKIGTVAGDFGAYGYAGGKWEYMPGLFKIEHEVTDYEEISAAEAKEIAADLSE